MKRIFVIFLLSAVCCLPSLFIGCGDGKIRTEPVRGVITLDGEPLEDAAVNFTPKNPSEGIASFGRTNARGEYLLQTLTGRVDAGTLPGEYIVTVSKYQLVPTGRRMVEAGSGDIVDEMESVFIFPGMSRYANTRTSPFSATVVKGKNEFDFALESGN